MIDIKDDAEYSRKNTSDKKPKEAVRRTALDLTTPEPPEQTDLDERKASKVEDL